MNGASPQGITIGRWGFVPAWVRTFPWKRTALVLATSALLGVVLVVTDGNMTTAGGLVCFLAIAAITVYRLEWGFCVFLFVVLLFDQYSIPGFPTPTTTIGYFLNINAIGWLPHIEQGILNLMELHLLMLFVIWFLTGVIGRNMHTVKVPFRGTLALWFLAVVASIAHGAALKGDMTISLWETRAFFYMALMIVFVPQIIRTEKDVRLVVWSAIAGVTVKALQGVERFASLGFSFGNWPDIHETLTNHEDPVFIVTLLVLLIALVLFGDHGKERRALTLLLIPLLIGYVAAQRRAAYASLMATLAAFVVLIPAPQRKVVIRAVGVFALFFALYLGVFWESYSRLGSVAQQFKATVTEEGGVRGEKDIQSTMYRKIENYNLGQTFQSSPIVGIGFGRAYDKVMTLLGSGFALGDYVAHNQILWVFVEMGVFGGLMFWLFFNTYVFRGAMIFRSISDPYLKAVCAMCVVAVINQLVVSYVDMQLTFYRNMVYLGTFMGLMPVIQTVDASKRNVVPGTPEVA